jgi:osmotically-inducible protein OsmY
MTRALFTAGAAAALIGTGVGSTSLEAQQSTPQAVSQQMQPGRQQMNPTERMIEDRIYVQLAERAWVGNDFKALVQGNEVTLSGTVPTEQTKQRILRIVRRTPGVFEVRDRLRVNPAVGAARGSAVADMDLAKMVAQKIAGTIPDAKAGEDWWFTGWRVEGKDRMWNLVVEADAGEITLEGEVPRASIMRKAVEAAMQVEGVRSVRSDLEQEPTYYPYGRSRYPSWGYYPYYGHPALGYGDPDDYSLSESSPHDFQGTHTLRGEVLSVDRQKGTMSLRSGDGTFDLRFPPSALKDIEKGDQVSVQMGLRETSQH